MSLRRRFEGGALTKSGSVQASPHARYSTAQDEVPQWKSKLSYRGLPYRFLDHQNGVAGYIKVLVVAASDLGETDWRLLQPLPGRRIRPYIQCNLGRVSSRTSAALEGQTEPSWKREVLAIEVLKGALKAGEPVLLDVQALNSQALLQNVVSGVVSTVSGGTLLGTANVLGLGCLELTGLLRGDMELLDTWVELEPRGRVHVIVEYEPKGIEPRRHDVVFMESFSRWHNSLVLPHGEPMIVRDHRGPWVLVAFDTRSGREGRVRLHRNSVFVVERLNWLDVSVALMSRPLDGLRQTHLGAWVLRRTRPLLASVSVLAAPLQASLVIFLTTVRMALRGVWAGTWAVTRDTFNS